MAAHKSSHKNNHYRPVSAFASNHSKIKHKSKKHHKAANNKISVKTRNNTRNYPGV